MFKNDFLKDKNYLLLFFGNLVSGVGSRVYGFGIGLFLLDLTGKASSMAVYVAVWSVILFVFGPIAATFTDRWQRKSRVLVLSDFGRGVVYALTAFGVYLSLQFQMINLTLVVIYIAVVFIAIQTAFFSPTVTALIPQIVKRDELVSASSIMQITSSIQNIAGLLFGAVLYLNFGIVVLMIINAVSFILSAISEMFIHISVNEHEEHIPSVKLKKVAGRVVNDLKDSFQYLFEKGKPIMMITFIILISATLIGPWFQIGVPYLFKEYFTFSNYQPEYLLASNQFVESIGVIIMSIIVAHIAANLKIYELLRVGGLIFSTIGILFFLVIRAFDSSMITSNVFIFTYIGINFIAGMVNASINAPLNASLQKYIEPKMIGKISMLINSFGGVLFPLTAIGAGYLIDHHSLYYVMYVMIFALMAITFIAYRSKELQKLS